jgi:N-methylhydantoinase B
MTTTRAVDPVTQEILRHAFVAIAEEMAVVEERSSFSSVIREMQDFSCGLFDAEGRMVAHSAQIPAQLGLMQFALAAARERLGPLEPGDICLCNHPYHGGTHTPDLQVFAPIHDDGRLLGYAGSIAHHIDVGGRVPGSKSAANTELYQEGLLIPPVLLAQGGERNAALWTLLGANVRDPDHTLGDIQAQVAACRRGSERILALARRFGASTVGEGMATVLDVTDQRAQAEFARWPDAEVEAEGFLDDDGIHPGEPVRIRARVRVEDGGVVVDLRGSAPQVAGGLNIPWASSHAGAYYAVRCFLSSEVPHNDGFTRRVRVLADEGTIVRPRFPAAVSARHLSVQRLAEVISRALGDLLPGRAIAADHCSFPSIVFRGRDRVSGDETLFADMLGGGGGARPDGPGDNGIDTYTSNCALLPTEVTELEHPWRCERSELVEGSGGRGANDGGLAIRRDYVLLADEGDATFYLEQADPRFGAQGRGGGERGAPARVRVRRRGSEDWEPLEHAKGELRLQRGDAISFQSAGGGGYGVPRPAYRESPDAEHDGGSIMSIETQGTKSGAPPGQREGAPPARDWEAISRLPEYRELVRRRRRFALWATSAALGTLAVFVVLVCWARDAMAREVVPGLPLGYLLALLEMAFTAGLGAVYVRVAKRDYGPLERAVVAAADRLDADEGGPR